jgi:hypothetical protein
MIGKGRIAKAVRPFQFIPPDTGRSRLPLLCPAIRPPVFVRLPYFFSINSCRKENNSYLCPPKWKKAKYK